MINATRGRSGCCAKRHATSTHQLLLPLLLVALAGGLAGCSGEWPQTTVYEDGAYRGKPDNLPWQGAPFNGSEREWQQAIDVRTQGQNEYRPIENR